MLILKALGITSVPGVPKNKQQAKRVVEFADRVIKMMRLQPEWCAVGRSRAPWAAARACGTSPRLPGRLELYRIERRFFNARFADVVLLVESHNGLGLDRVLLSIAPATRLGLPGLSDPCSRQAWVSPSPPALVQPTRFFSPVVNSNVTEYVLHSLQFTVYGLQFTVYSLQITVYSF